MKLMIKNNENYEHNNNKLNLINQFGHNGP